MRDAAIAQRVDALEGVTAVTNEIAVLRHRLLDDRLPYAFARAIYGNPAFNSAAWRRDRLHARRSWPRILSISDE